MKNAKAFVKANDESPVVSGHTITLKSGGGQYELQDGRIFRLTAEESRALPHGYPKWYFPKEMFGYPSMDPCEVCEGFKNNQSEPRFGYVLCEDHYRVPGTEFEKARSQYKKDGKTEWDSH